ncbi:MAG: hypothetical protein ABJN22_06145 [Litorimonas sp.]
MPMTNATQLIADMKAVNAMTDAQFLELRRAFGADMSIDAREADAIFELDKLETKPTGWADYFTLILTTYLVHQGQPQGYINDAMAAWLIARIDHDGVVETETELRLLMNVLKVAEQPGERLEAYAINQVKEAVLSGRGRVSHGTLTPGVIGKAEVELLRRVFYSVGGDGGMGITRMEAEQIFELNDATSGRENDPEWQTFFVGAIANHLMMIAAPEKVDLTEMKRREAWLTNGHGRRTPGEGRFEGLSVSAVLDAFKDVFGLKKVDPTGGFSNLDLPASQQSEKITSDEANWLVRALHSDGKIDANERALLEFIRVECPAIDETLKPILDAA